MPVMRNVAFAAVVGFGAHSAMGGWTVISVVNPPLSLEAGASYRMEYTVRQHGQELLTGLRGSVLVQPGDGGSAGPTSVRSEAGARKGYYTAIIRVPDSDRVTLTVKSGFGAGGWGDLTLVSLPVTRAGEPRPIVAPAERGRQLFVAKGCGSCHLNGDVPEFAHLNRTITGVGPDLTGRRLEASYIRQRLSDPGSLPPIGTGNVRMPNLDLATADVEALVALLTGSGTRAGL